MIELKQVLVRKRYQDSPNKIRWKNKVLRDHADTSRVAESILKDSRRSKTRMERSLDETRDLIKVYHDFSDDYQQACNLLKKRIDDDEEEQKQKQNQLRLKFILEQTQILQTMILRIIN